MAGGEDIDHGLRPVERFAVELHPAFADDVKRAGLFAADKQGVPFMQARQAGPGREIFQERIAAGREERPGP